MNRRSLLKLGAAAPLAAVPVPDVPCNHPLMPDHGEIFVVFLEATRERKAPKVEIENWHSDIQECDICEQTWFKSYKVREPFHEGGWNMVMPPVLSEPSEVVVAVPTTCKMWVNGQEVDWQAFETTPTGAKRGFLT